MTRTRRTAAPGRAPRGASILIVGSGGREHALGWRLRRDEPNATLLFAPGNPGMAELGSCFDVPATDLDRLVELAVRERVDLVVVGPETPLEMGLADRLRERNVPVFGPSREAAKLESSKAFAKALMLQAGVPTAKAQVFRDAGEARRAVRTFGAPVVVKASGLAAGKGVIVCESMGEAYEAIDLMLLGGGLGDAGRELLIEEFMTGEELSLFYLTDGTRAVPLPGAQDHKRLRAGDQGPNTGGMGAYAPVLIARPEIVARVTREIVEPTLAAMRERGTPFTGLLYVGLMLTKQGPMVVEFNCRFGDPETQAVLPVLECAPSLLELMRTIARGQSLPDTVEVRAKGCAVTTVVAAAGYPERPRTGDRISLPTEGGSDAIVFHAGTRRSDQGDLVTAGGRVVAVTAVAPTFAEAQRRSVTLAAEVRFVGAQHRADIGWRELARLGPESAGASGD